MSLFNLRNLFYLAFEIAHGPFLLSSISSASKCFLPHLIFAFSVGQIASKAVLPLALLDRLLHHAHVIPRPDLLAERQGQATSGIHSSYRAKMLPCPESGISPPVMALRKLSPPALSWMGQWLNPKKSNWGDRWRNRQFLPKRVRWMVCRQRLHRAWDFKTGTVTASMVLYAFYQNRSQ